MATFDLHSGLTLIGPGFGSTNDTVRVSGGSTVNSGIATGAGSDTVLAGASTINGGILTGDGADVLTVDSNYSILASVIPAGPVTVNANGVGSSVAMGAGNDTVSLLNEVQINGNVLAGNGDDDVRVDITDQLYPGTTTGSITGVLDGGAGNDTITVDDAVSIGGVNGGVGSDTINLNSTTTYTGIIHGGDPATPGQDGIDIINLNAGTFQAGVDGGVDADTINIAQGTIFTGTNSVTGGAHNDTINLNGGQFGAGVTVGGGTGNDSIVVAALEGNLTIDGGEDGADDGTADGDIDTLDLSALVGTVVYTSDPQNGESGIFTEAVTGRTITFTNIENFIPPICFAAGTMIDTKDGPCAVEALQIGDLVETRDNGLRPIRWIGRRRIGAEELARFPKLRPICIPTGALGHNAPEADLILSPQHRVLIRSTIAQRMFDQREVLVAARHLIGTFGIHEIEDCTGIEYFHILCDQHEIVVSNGTYSETLFLGPQAIKSVSDEAQEEIARIFPEVLDPGFTPGQTARSVAAGAQARRLSQRHERNGRPLYIG